MVTMRTYSGPFLTQEGFIQAQIHIEGGSEESDIWGDEGTGTIVDFEEGADEGTPSVIIPTFYNAHTHSADSVVKEVPKGTLSEIVGPGGFKHKALSEADEEDLVNSLRRYIQRAIDMGVSDIIDFREGGIDGLHVIKSAFEGFEERLRLRIMTRPSEMKYDEWELNKIMSLSDGIGLSSYRDWDETLINRIAQAANKMGKPLALHCSEDEREPIDEVLSLGVHHLVHMVEGTTDDFLACVLEDVPIVVCPRSNMFFGKHPDIPAMLDAGVKLCLGTDNAMISTSNMFREMELAYRVSRLTGDVDPMEILMMATWNPRKALNLPYCIGPSESGDDSKEQYMILSEAWGDPAYDVVTRKGLDDIMDIVEW